MLSLFFYRDKFFLLTFAAGTAPSVGQFLERRSGGDVLLGVSLLWVIGIFAGAFELAHIVCVLVARLKGRAGALPNKEIQMSLS
jgi:hypothetical protein